MRKILVLTFVLVVLLSVAYAEINDYSEYVVVNKYNEAVQVAEFTGRPLMMLFSMANCKDCVDFKENVLKNEEVAEFLKERFIIVDVQPYPHLRGSFPLNGDMIEEFPYSELYRKYKIKRTPTNIFMDRDFNFVNQITGVYSPQFFVETVKSFDRAFEDAALNDLRLITEDNALLLLNTLPNCTILDYTMLNSMYDTLDKHNYYIIENGDFHDVQEYLQEKTNPLKTVFVFEGYLDYNSPDVDVKENDTLEEVGNWTNIDRPQVKEVITENIGNSDFYIFDVRTPDEYSRGNIENSINIDFFSDDFEDKLSEYDTAATYLVMCQSGGRSTKAVKLMEELGFEFIYHYTAGYSDWEKTE